MNPESAFSRHRRIAAIAAGFGSIIFGLLALGDVLKETPRLVPEFGWPAAILYFGIPTLLIPIGRWGSIALVQLVARVHTIVTVLILLGWAPAQLGVSDGSAPWILNAVAVSAATCVVGWGGKVVWVYLVGISVAGAALRYLSLNGSDVVIPWEDGLSILEVSVVMAALLTVTVGLGRAQDDALALAVGDARAAAEADSKARQRTRFGALLHDDVMSTLLVASHAIRRNPTIERSAERAIEHLDSFIAATPEELPQDREVFAIEVRAAVTEVVDGVQFTGTFDDFADTIPGPVALAMTAALAEAARNSVRHASTPGVNRRAHLRSVHGSISVEFADTGPGFDPERVSPTRFGIRTSIRDRMSAVGGSADISSAPGRGTLVLLSWTRADR